jgi:hypothetical protein
MEFSCQRQGQLNLVDIDISLAGFDSSCKNVAEIKQAQKESIRRSNTARWFCMKCIFFFVVYDSVAELKFELLDFMSMVE